MMKSYCIVMILLLLVLPSAACNAPTQGEPSAQPAKEPTPGANGAAAPLETTDHRIGIRLVDGVGEFYDRVTDQKFVPRGVNYVLIGPQQRDDGGSQYYHAVFDPGMYDSAAVDAVFRKLHAQGYNTVRVFLSQNTIVEAGPGLDPAYMDNVVDLLRLAHDNQLYVIPTIDWMPGGRYGSLLGRDCCDKFTMMNVNFLTQGGLESNQAFFQDFARYLIDHGAAMDALLAYSLRNELFFDMDFPPLSLTSGMLATVNGRTYNMGDPADKKKMMDENLVYWLDGVREAILEVDPTALVGVGFFAPQEPNPNRIGDERYVTSRPAISQSRLDFIDLHAYPGGELTLDQYVENFGMQGMQQKPVLMGEFGVAKNSISTEQTAARVLMDWQVESCQYGFDGWLLWEWNVNESMSEFYNPHGGNGYVDQALAPLNRPDPCVRGQFSFIEDNIALGSDVTASAFLQNEPPVNAVDATGAQWGAGASPTQWIQIDLGEPKTIREIRLTTAQSPDGNTTHRVYVRGPGGDLQLVHTFSGYTREGQVLSFVPDVPLGDIQYVRITTTDSLSWVAWKEIEILAP